MNAKNTRPQHPPMIALGDIYYTVFRHKKKIALLAVLGVVGALILPLVWPQSYQSTAELMIKYVADAGAPMGPNGDGSRTTYVDVSGRNIINTEMHILSSLDLAQEVATNVGAAKILGQEGSAVTAAAVIHANMLVDNPDGSDVIRIRYSHKDPILAQMVLTQVVKTYLENHAKIHQPGGQDDMVTAERDELATRLKKTEDELTSIKTNLDIVSFEDTPKIFGDQISKIQNDLFDSQDELAQHKAILAELNKHIDEASPHTASTDKVDGTNTMAAGTNAVVAGTNTVAAGTNTVAAGTNTVALEAPASAGKLPSPEEVLDYKNVCDLIDTYRRAETELLKTYLPESPHVKDKRAQIAAALQQKKQMEQEYTSLVAAAPRREIAKAAADGAASTALADKLLEENTRIAALQTKIQNLTEQMAYVRSRSAALDAQSSRIFGIAAHPEN